MAADEVTQALATLDLAREAGIQRIVYFSTFNSALFDAVPHFAGKYLVERVIDAQAIPATVLRPAYFMQNDLMFRDALKAGIYLWLIGDVGVAMVDIRDIADAAVAELLRRERARFGNGAGRQKNSSYTHADGPECSLSRLDLSLHEVNVCK